MHLALQQALAEGQEIAPDIIRAVSNAARLGVAISEDVASELKDVMKVVAQKIPVSDQIHRKK